LSQRLNEHPSGLTPREIDTLRWTARGLTHGEIATRIDVTDTTGNTYAKLPRAKPNVGHKAEFTRKAIELGHLDDDQQTHSAA
jgi:DNA-binding CsgD family transcriptional regulator